MLDSRVLARFLQLAVQSLDGEWVLLGGTLLPAVGIKVRSTADIDLVGLSEREDAQNSDLMRLAEAVGLPVQSVNPAAGYFFKKSNYQKSDLIVFLKGAKAVVYRPSVKLYWTLKVARLTETDFEDCGHYYNHCVKVGDPVSTQELRSVLSERKKTEASPEQLKRLEQLESMLVNAA